MYDVLSITSHVSRVDPPVCYILYCNGFDQCVARQQLCKHSPTCNYIGSCVFHIRSDVTHQYIAVTWHVFAVMSVQRAPVDWLDSDHVTYVSCDACPFHCYISKKSPGGFRAVTSSSSSSGRSTWTSKQAVSLRSTEEYKKSAREDLINVCFEDFICAIVQWYWECVWFRETFIVPVL
jgi:hypothetical protein